MGPTIVMTTEPLDVLFVLNSLDSLRCFQPALELEVERGHHVHLLLEKDGRSAAEQAWLEGMLERPNFTSEVAEDLRDDVWHRRGVKLRAGMEYVQVREPLYRGRPRYQRKIDLRSPHAAVRRLVELPLMRTPAGLRLLYGVLAAFERSLPLPSRADAYVDRRRPDVIALGNYGSRRSLHSVFVRAARKRGIPVASCVASWDNLTTRPRMCAHPHELLVWNETQRREAAEIHRIPPERVAVTGAPNFDHWFTWQPRPREEFLRRVGLDPTRPVILWVAGALNQWERPETVFVHRWLAAIRGSDDPLLREAGVLLRPHPYRGEEWLAADFSEHGRVAVWPRDHVTMPMEVEQKADYYDSIFHSSAVVGIITSAMIEAAIVGRPVLTVLDPEHHDSQLGALHHSYLLEGSGGAVRVAQDLDEHVRQLSAIVAGRDGEARSAAESFVRSFVRPHGLERPAAPFVVDAFERLAAAPIGPERDPSWVVVLRRLIVLAAPVATGGRRKRMRRSGKGIRRFAKRIRRSSGAVSVALRSRLRVLRRSPAR